MSDIDKISQSVRHLSIDDEKTEEPNDIACTEFLNNPVVPWTQDNLRTGIVYDEFMKNHTCPWIKPDECPERYQCIYDKLQEYKLIEKCLRLPSKPACREDVLLCHSEEYFERVKALRGETCIDKLKDASCIYDGVYFNKDTYDVAMLSLGCALTLTDEVLNGTKIKNGFALIRTPGHHAMRNVANGYCIFNNAAIVAKHAVVRRKAKRIVIVDWDVHHGQGTQSLFYDDSNVLYISIHRYENGTFWPNLKESNFNYIGVGQGKGFNINVPLNHIDCTDGDYLAIWFNLILPIAYEFDPDLVVISAGFDAAIGCPEGKNLVLPATFSKMCHSLMALSNGRVVVLLEGGYNLLSLAESAAMTVASLLSYPSLTDKLADYSVEKVRDSLLSAICALRPHWKSLCGQGVDNSLMKTPTTTPSGKKTSSSRKKSQPPVFNKIYSPMPKFLGDLTSVKNDDDKYNIYEVSCQKDDQRQQRLNNIIDTKVLKLSHIQLPYNFFSKRTYLVFDDTFTLHKTSDETHPECPARYTTIMNKLRNYGLVDRCTIGTSRRATEDEIAEVHSTKYIRDLAQTQFMSQKQLDDKSNLYDSIYINQHTFECASLAAGSVLQAVDQVMSNNNLNAFACIRPPGHHAGPDYPAGFCFFNNVVVGAHYALKKYPEVCKKILIVDFDFHHGDGVQTCIDKNDKRFLYMSLHGYENGREYPFQSMSDVTEGGVSHINVPWTGHRMGDSEYLLAFFNIILPIAHEFCPDLVIVSAGYDAAINDPLGRYKISPACYGHFIHHLQAVGNGRMVACLEGGYNLESISEASAHTVSALLGDPPMRLASLSEPNHHAVRTIQIVMQRESPHRRMLSFNYNLPEETFKQE